MKVLASKCMHHFPLHLMSTDFTLQFITAAEMTRYEMYQRKRVTGYNYTDVRHEIRNKVYYTLSIEK